MCPGSFVRYAVWAKFGHDDRPHYLPIGRTGEAMEGAIDWAERCLAEQKGPCWVGVYRYVWDNLRQQNQAMLVWEDDNETEG